MKKIISLLLTAVMLITFTTPAFAEDYVDIADKTTTPVIIISGDADPLYDAEGNKLLDLSNMSDPDNASDKDSEKEQIMESVANVLYPFLVEGLLTGKWDNYYKNLQKEIGEILGDALLDCNGEVSNGSGISQKRLDEVAYDKTHDKNSGGYYYAGMYRFWYDWRLDPIEIADEFNEYIQAVKSVTHHDKVAVIGRCLGTSVVMAYVEKYGLDDICGIGLDGGITNGSEVLSEIITGRFILDGNAISRFMIDCDAFGLKIDSLLTYTVDLLAKGNVFNSISTAMKETIYYKVIEGVTSALALSTAFTWPSYWAGISAEDYETAKDYVFGGKGSEKRTKYAGLIKKLDNYDERVRQHLPELMQKISDDEDVNLIIISKYGMQMFPAIESCNNLGDQFVSVKRSSFGATTSNIYGELSDEYIDGLRETGELRYLSPDRQIDASTCMFRDNTWFVKGASHTNWTSVEDYLMLTVTTYDRQLTVNDFALSQFMVYDDETREMSRMTVDNCDCYNWSASEAEDSPRTVYERVFAFLKSLFTWLKEVIKRISASRPAG